MSALSARFATALLAMWCSTVEGVECKIEKSAVFANGQVKVRLVRSSEVKNSANFVVFKAPLAINTDGAPTSYHPEDFKGERLAINRIDNGIAISRAGGGSKLPVAEKRRVFDQWRRSREWRVPLGYRITWQNVIAADSEGRPCIFKIGANAGYFGSLTALKNGLRIADAGECLALDQLDLRTIPATVLRGGASNPLQQFGATKGDLVLAINPTTKVAVPAIIGDTGNADRIGEGSVALNMQLLGNSKQPRTYEEALKLDTGTSSMIVATLPGSAIFKRERPYSAGNISSRVETWAKEKYGSMDAFKAVVLACSEKL